MERRRRERVGEKSMRPGGGKVIERVGKGGLLAARATGAAFGVDPRGVAPLPVVMLRVP